MQITGVNENIPVCIRGLQEESKR